MNGPQPGRTPKPFLRYRPAGIPGQRCGTCSMEFRRGDMTLCTRVSGEVEDDHVCDDWSPRAARSAPPDLSWGAGP